MIAKKDLKLLEAFNDLTQEERHWLIQVAHELRKAETKHPAWQKDIIYAAAIVGEEAGELIRAALNYKLEGGSEDELYKEAIQTGAMALRLLKNTFYPLDDIVTMKEATNG